MEQPSSNVGGSNLESENRFQCIKCFRSYKYRKDLTRHAKYYCGVEPSFKCDACDYRTKRKSSLKSHIGIRHPDNFAKVYRPQRPKN